MGEEEEEPTTKPLHLRGPARQPQHSSLLMLQTVCIKSAWPAKREPATSAMQALHLGYATQGITGSKAWTKSCSSLQTCHNQEDPVCAAKTVRHKCCDSLQGGQNEDDDLHEMRGDIKAMKPRQIVAHKKCPTTCVMLS